MEQILEICAVAVVLVGFARICIFVGRNKSANDVMVILGESISLKSGQDNTNR